MQDATPYQDGRVDSQAVVPDRQAREYLAR
jgi:hypothetical protein